MTRIAAAVLAVGLVVLAIIGSVTGTAASRPEAPPVKTAPVTTANLVCPALNGNAATTHAALFDAAQALTPPSTSSGTVTSSLLVGPKTTSKVIKADPTAVIFSTPKTSSTLAFAATGSVAATVGADQVGESPIGANRGLTGVRCEAPAISWWFSGADGRVGYDDILFLANPSAETAVVTVSMWGGNGVLPNDRLQAIRVPARSGVRLPIATIAPDAPTITIHVRATSGSVTAAVLDHRTTGLASDGSDFLPATAAPARAAVVSGYMNGTGARELVIGNPGPLDATVGLKVISRSGTFMPSGQNEVVVKAGHTREVSVERALNGSTGAIELTSDQPVVGQGMSVAPSPGKRPDLMWLAATAPLSGPAPIANGHDPDGGQTYLLLTAPAGAAQVRVTTTTGKSLTVSVPAGHSLGVNLGATIATPTGPRSFVVTPVGNAPVYGTRVLQFMGAHGALITSEPLVTLPPPLVLPPVREAPRVALR